MTARGGRSSISALFQTTELLRSYHALRRSRNERVDLVPPAGLTFFEYLPKIKRNLGACLPTPPPPPPPSSQSPLLNLPSRTDTTLQIASAIKTISHDEKDSFRSRQLERLLAIKEKEAGGGGEAGEAGGCGQ